MPGSRGGRRTSREVVHPAMGHTAKRSWSQDANLVLSDVGPQARFDPPDCLSLVGGYRGFWNSYEEFHTFSCTRPSYLPQETRAIISPLSR